MSNDIMNMLFNDDVSLNDRNRIDSFIDSLIPQCDTELYNDLYYCIYIQYMHDFKRGVIPSKLDFDANEYDKIRNELALYYKKLIEPPEIEKGLTTCFKCKSQETYKYSVQIRSADEPMTNFYTCAKCGNKWKN